MLKEWKELKCPLTILVTGKTGVGKSSLINGFIGTAVQEVSDRPQEGKYLTSSTTIVSSYTAEKEGIDFLIVDTPGLQDLDVNDGITLKEIGKPLKKSQGFHLVLYCLNMTTVHIDASEKRAMRNLTKKFKPKIWQNTAICLTFANKLQPPPDYEHDDDQWFEDKLIEFSNIIQKLLVEINVPPNIVKGIPIIPAGYWKKTRQIPEPWKLPNRQDWFSDFWICCATRLDESARIAMFESQKSRIVVEHPASPIQGSAFERPIYIPLYRSNFSGSTNQDSTAIKAMKTTLCVTVGLVLGGATGAIVGILGGPISSAAVGVAGAATGATMGGCVASAMLSKSDETKSLPLSDFTLSTSVQH